MATQERTDFLRFNAFSIKDLITRKLAQDSNFTDQIYAGSNLNILIDIVSYMYQTLMFNLNSAAAETMWSDTKIYENINRLCAFLGYNPHGMNPSFATFSFPIEQIVQGNKGTTIPRYSYLDTNKIDASGNRIYFSTVEDIIVQKTDQRTTKEITLYNGQWKLYDTVLVSNGTDWETFVLNGIRSDYSTNTFVANNFIHVYVQDPRGVIKRYNMTDGGLFKSRNEFFSMDAPIPKIYSENDYVFNLRLNETKTYEITFGNNRQGHRLEKGSIIYVFYLESNGPGSELGLREVVNGVLNQNFGSYKKSDDGRYYYSVYEKILESGSSSGLNNIIKDGVQDVTNISESIGFSFEESVDQIRDFAPNWFRMGNRLVTQRDYEYFLKNSPYFRNALTDVKCMNNWDYMSTFYKWLYEMGCRYHNEINPEDELNGRRFLRQDNLLKTRRQYADPADSNNIYLWCILNSQDTDANRDMSLFQNQVDEWKRYLLPIKDLTHEPYFVDALRVNFMICANPNVDYVRNNYIYKSADVGIEAAKNENYIEITIADEVIYASSTIQNQIQTIIYNFFRQENFKLGQYVDFNLLQNQIFAINGVNRIRTVFKKSDDESSVPTVVRNGLCFASWTDDPILQIRNRVEAIDLEISSAGRSLEPFQFPRLFQTIESISVKIIKKSAASLNTVAY